MHRADAVPASLSRLLVWVGFCLLIPGLVSAGGGTLDDTWTVTVNGQTAPIYPNGSFRIPNVQATDNFGPGGPGTAPDFLADEWTRAIATRTVAGQTEYAYSEPFKVVQGATIRVESFTFTTSPPPLPVSIAMSVSSPTIEVGQTAQVTVTGTLPDGSTIDVTPTTAWTSYKVSNPATASIDDNGVISGLGVGYVMIVAVNEGGVATRSMLIRPASPQTTVMGHTRLANGDILPGVTVEVQSTALSTVSDANGFFSLPGVPSDQGNLTINASLIGGAQDYVASITGIVPQDGMITDVGIITMYGGPELLATSASGHPGDVVECGVVMNSEQDLSGVSFGLCHDPAQLGIVSLPGDMLGSSLQPLAPDFVGITLGVDGLTCGIIIDFLGASFLDPGIGIQVIAVDYEISPTAVPGEVPIDFCSSIELPPPGGPFPVDIVFSDTLGLSFSPATTGGRVTILP
ncbi:MAG: hypothetical protein KDC38_00235 [Planctomycetes bacterium]|nr:hypothetical protein [Planctomycetota bacterium]